MSTNLDKLMQMATLEQMNNMIQQMNKKSESEAKDVLSLPIVQKVIMAYEDELKLKKSSNDCKCNCKCDELIPTILEHLNNHNSKLQLIENRLNDLFALLESKESKQEQKELMADKNQTKLTSFPGFGQIPLSELIITSISTQQDCIESQQDCIESQQQDCIESQQQDCIESQSLEKENITLNIEDFDDEDIQESTDTDTEVVADADFEDHVQTEAVEEDEEAVEDEEVVEGDEEAVEEDEEAVEEDEEVVEGDEEAVEDEEVVEGDEEVVEGDEEVVEEDKSVEDESDENVSTEEEVATEDELEDQEQKEDVDEDLDQEQSEEEVFEIEIDDITYFATDEENGILYEVDKDGEVGKKVGIIKDGEPIFS